MENPCHHRDLLKDVFALKNEFGVKEPRDFTVPKKWEGELKKNTCLYQLVLSLLALQV